MNNSEAEQLINKLFDLLDEWRKLPAYQLERRADIFFAIYLNEIIKGKFNQSIEHIIPEFPVRTEESNRSFKIDYVAVCNTTKKVFLIELKTDDSSHNSKQDDYLERTKSNNIKHLVEGVLDIYKATSQKYKKKYDKLLALLTNIGWVDKFKQTVIQDYDITIVYIQPTNKDNSENVITFEKIAEILSDRKDELTQRFVKSLRNWA